MTVFAIKDIIKDRGYIESNTRYIETSEGY